ncbi:MAG: hypothetical protein IPO66_20060 [Rhodanobacteraceae bacterium]|nr:hypothetical protein [Rhodanobacteraceae bacterium]
MVGIFTCRTWPGASSRPQPDVIAHIEHALRIAGSEHVDRHRRISRRPTTPEFIEKFRITRGRKAAGIAAPDETEEGYRLPRSQQDTPIRETLGELLLARGQRHRPRCSAANLLRVFGAAWQPLPAGAASLIARANGYALADQGTIVHGQ